MSALPESVTIVRPFSSAPLSAPPAAAAAAEPSVPLPRPFPSKAQWLATAAPAVARAPLPTNPPMASGTLESPADLGATAAEFAVDLGATANVDAARARWNELRASQSPLFDNLKPVIALKDGGKSGQELHLLAGPLASNATSARLCAVLAGTGTPCASQLRSRASASMRGRTVETHEFASIADLLISCLFRRMRYPDRCKGQASA
jgi:hypothetical protein